MERGNVWKYYIEGIMNDENDCDYIVKADAVEGPAVCVSREDVLQVLTEM